MCWTRDGIDAAIASALRREIQAYLAAYAPDDANLGTAALIVGELLANVVRHAPGPFCVTLDWRQEEPVLIVHDTGPGFALETQPATDNAEAGRGLYIVSYLAQHLTADRLPSGGMRIAATLPVARRRFPEPRWCPMDSPHERNQACRWPASRQGERSAR